MYPGITTSRLGIDWKKRGKDMKKERIFWGLFFIVAAIFLLVSRLGVLGDIGVWSLLLTVFFVACLVKSIEIGRASCRERV